MTGKLCHTVACGQHSTPGTPLAPGQAGSTEHRVDLVAIVLRDAHLDRLAVARHMARFCALHLYADEARLRYPPDAYADLV